MSAFCDKHQVWVGFVFRDGDRVFVQRFAPSDACDCPAKDLRLEPMETP